MALLSKAKFFSPLLLLLLSLAHFTAALSVPKIFGNGAVLQAAPEKAQVWGSLDGVDSQVSLNIKCQSGYTNDFVAQNVSIFSLSCFFLKEH